MKQGLHIDKHGHKYWYQDDEFHRLDGPAIEWTDGEKWYYVNGKRHHRDGPAVIYPDGEKWFINDKELTKKEFQNYLIQQNLKIIL